MTVAPLVAEDWTFDPLEPAGAAELYRRIDAAEPRRVRRAELEGYVGLTDRELYELGCTLAPLNVRSGGGMAGWRLAVVGGALAASVGVAGALIGSLDAVGLDRGDSDPFDTAHGLGAAVMFLAFAYGGFALLRGGIRALRTLAARRRRTGAHVPRRPADDPHGRATVAVLRGPGLVRVRLLWVRGDAEDAASVEVRTLAERRIEEDDAGRAEDAIAALSEIALRADNAHGLRRYGGLAALGLGRRGRTPRERPHDGEPARGEPPALAVAPAWEPEPLADAGQADLSRRLCLAPIERWSAAVLEPLLVRHAAGVPRDAPAWPRDSERGPARHDLRKPLRWALWAGVVTFVSAMFSNDDAAPTGVAVAAEARLRSQSVGRSAHYLQTLLGRLGRVPATIGEPALRREPLVWVAGLLGAVLVASSVKHTIAGTWFEHGAGSRAISYAWVLLAAYIVVTAARRIRDPFAL